MILLIAAFASIYTEFHYNRHPPTTHTILTKSHKICAQSCIFCKITHDFDKIKPTRMVKSHMFLVKSQIILFSEDWRDNTLYISYRYINEIELAFNFNFNFEFSIQFRSLLILNVSKIKQQQKNNKKEIVVPIIQIQWVGKQYNQWKSFGILGECGLIAIRFHSSAFIYDKR